MGGQVSCLLSQDATHLVVKEVGSVKYFSAAHVKIPIMTVDWIEHLWKHGQSRFVFKSCQMLLEVVNYSGGCDSKSNS